MSPTDLGLTDANASCHCSTHVGHDTHQADRVARADAPAVLSSDYLVEGMTCSHCVASVTEELSAVEGVEGVSVDLQPGGRSRVTVASTVPVSDETIRAAVEEAGYSLSGRP